MQVKSVTSLFAAAVAMATLSNVANAEQRIPDASAVLEAEAGAEAEPRQRTFRGLMQQVLRAGDASRSSERFEREDKQVASLGGTATDASEAEAAAAAVVAEPEPADPEQVTPAAQPQPASAPAKAEPAAASDGPPFHAIVSRYAQQYGVPSALAHAVIRVESNYRPRARGRSGEIGLMQIKPSTARGMGYRGSADGLFDPEKNIKYGIKYLAEAYRLGGGNTCGAILRYNAGHGAKHMNPTSSAYCAKVKRILGK